MLFCLLPLPALLRLQLGADAGKEFGLVVRLRHVVVALFGGKSEKTTRAAITYWSTPRQNRDFYLEGEPLDDVCGQVLGRHQYYWLWEEGREG